MRLRARVEALLSKRLSKGSDVMTLLMCVASLVFFPTLAFTGKAYRGIYFAGALIAFALGFLFISSTSGGPPTTAAEARGQEFLEGNGASIGGWFLVTAFALVVAGLAFRPARTGQPR